MPRVSIVTPLHNKGPYIAATIESVRRQTMTDWELIVVENGSTDDGPATVRAVTGEPRLQLLESPQRGPGAARNHGLGRARGEWILFLDADDLIEPEHLARLLADAAAAPRAAIVAGYWKEFSGETPTDFRLHAPFCAGQDARALRDACVAFAPWAVHATLIKRAALRPDRWWPTELDRGLGEDIHFWFRLVLENEVHCSAGQGALYRVETAGRRNQVHRIEPWYRGNDAAVSANLRHLEAQGTPLTPGQCSSLLRLYSELYWQARCQRADAIATEARQKAELWLRRAQAQPGTGGWTLRLRRLLGLRLYLFLRYTFRGTPAHWKSA